tara:strand:- start:10954 stop:11436 length:483 start_codon:yes stop_codon:yes gene_type:complete
MGVNVSNRKFGGQEEKPVNRRISMTFDTQEYEGLPDSVSLSVQEVKTLFLNSRRDDVDLYLEAHVTIEPVFGERLDLATEIGARYKFKPAKLFMQKDRAVTPERSDKDTFLTGHGQSKKDMEIRTRAVVSDLLAAGFAVWRYKVEDTLYDSRNADIFGLL